MSRLFVVVAVVLLSAVLFAPSSAEACECIDLFAVSPNEESANVPVNTWVRITGNKGEQGKVLEATLHELTFGGVEVEVDVERRSPTGRSVPLFLVPSSPLTAGAEYIVRVAGEERSRFTVAPEGIEDTTPPEFAGISGSVRKHEPQRATCAARDWMELELAPIEGDQTPADDFVYMVYAGQTADSVELDTPVAVMGPEFTSLGKAGCDLYYPHDIDAQPWIVVTAVDRAGNESAKPVPTELAPSGCGCGVSGGAAQTVAVLAFVALWRGGLRRRVTSSGRARREA